MGNYVPLRTWKKIFTSEVKFISFFEVIFEILYPGREMIKYTYFLLFMVDGIR